MWRLAACMIRFSKKNRNGTETTDWNLGFSKRLGQSHRTSSTLLVKSASPRRCFAMWPCRKTAHKSSLKQQLQTVQTQIASNCAMLIPKRKTLLWIHMAFHGFFHARHLSGVNRCWLHEGYLEHPNIHASMPNPRMP